MDETSKPALLIPPASANDYLTTTGTSALLIVLIHVIFVYQWNGRKVRRKEVLVSYNVLVKRGQYHKLFLAILSHPPAIDYHSPLRGHGNQTGTTGFFEGEGLSALNTPDDNRQPQDIQSRIFAIGGQLGNFAYQSGFASMLFNSHIIWSCRSLEAFYNFNLSHRRQLFESQHFEHVGSANRNRNVPLHDQEGDEDALIVNSLQYVRVIFALAAIALTLELRFSHSLLKVSKLLQGGSDSSGLSISVDMNNALAMEEGGRSTTYHSRIQHKILHRPIGTLTALTSSLVYVFRHSFEYVPLQVLPFVDNRWLLLGFSLPPAITSTLCWCILAYLSYPSHPVTPVMCGLLSGLCWTLFTSFLAEPYWGNSVIGCVLLMCCMSIRANGYSAREGNEGNMSAPTWIPCIDFVSWNRRGERIRSVGTSSVMGGWDSPQASWSEDAASLDNDESDGNSSRSSEALYGRIPYFGESFDDFDDSNNRNGATSDIEMSPRLESERIQNTVRSRRGVNSE